MDKLKPLKLITHTTFVGCFLLFAYVIFINREFNLLPWFLLLFFTSLISELIYQFLSGVRIRRNRKKSIANYKDLSSGQYAIINNETEAVLGELPSDQLNFLRKCFVDQGMEDNDFYFNPLTLKMFLKEEKPCDELKHFLENVVNDSEIELRWEPTPIQMHD